MYLQKAAKEEKKLALRRKKDQAAAAAKSEAAHKEKMERLEKRTQNSLKRLDKMRKTEFVLAKKRKAAESDTANDKPKTATTASKKGKKGPSEVDKVCYRTRPHLAFGISCLYLTKHCRLWPGFQ